MTTDIPAGRELDALVATKIMGWRRLRLVEAHPGIIGRRPDDQEMSYFWHDAAGEEVARAEGADDCGDCGTPDRPWSPSTDIAAAWTVVKKLQGWTDPVVHVSVVVLPHAGGSSFCSIESMRRGEVLGKDTWIASAKEEPEAICRAALKAVGHG